MRVLFLTHRLPYAPDRGDRVRSYHIARVLSRQCEVDVVSFVHSAEEGRSVARLRNMVSSATGVPVPKYRNRLRAAASLGSNRPLTHLLLDSPQLRHIFSSLIASRRPDVVLAYCSGMARFPLEAPLAGTPFVLDMVDVDSAKWASLAEVARPPLRWIYRREARCLEAFERAVVARASATLVVNDREAATLTRLAPHSRIEVIENGVDLAQLSPPTAPSSEATVVFCGVMNYPPNEEAALWLGREVWPLVRARRSDARLVLVGSDPTRSLRQLGEQEPDIDVTGRVEDVRPYLWQAAVAAAPLRIARGIQNKVLEAVAAGLPVVVTPAVADGLPVDVMPACAVAGSAPAFAAAILDFLAISPDERRRRAGLAELDRLTWETRLARLPQILEAAAATR